MGSRSSSKSARKMAEEPAEESHSGGHSAPRDDKENMQSKTMAFYREIDRTVSAGFHTLLLALGSRLGLFEVLSGFSKPSTAQQIADRANLKERYVREWLGAMVAFSVVEINKAGTLYFLPEYKRRVLSPQGMDVTTFSWAVPMIAAVSDDLMQCFQKDGPQGLPYSKYGLFHEWRDQSTRGIQSHQLISVTPGLQEKLRAGGANVCELGCSTGRSTLMMAEYFPKSHFYGLDISEEAIKRARELANEKGLKNVTFLVQDICKMPADWTNRFDHIVGIDVIHDVPHATQALAETYRTLKPGAWFSLLDINLHTNPALNANSRDAGIMYTISLFHCMPVSLNEDGGEGLGAAWGKEKALQMLAEAGFKDCYFPNNMGLIYHCLAKKPAKR